MYTAMFNDAKAFFASVDAEPSQHKGPFLHEELSLVKKVVRQKIMHVQERLARFDVQFGDRPSSQVSS